MNIGVESLYSVSLHHDQLDWSITFLLLDMAGISETSGNLKVLRIKKSVY